MATSPRPPPRSWVDDKFDAASAKHGKDGGSSATELAHVIAVIDEVSVAHA